MKSIFGYRLLELDKLVFVVGIKSFVARQLCEWVYKKQVLDPDLMTSLSKVNRALLTKQLSFSLFSKVTSVPSSDGSAINLFVF